MERWYTLVQIIIALTAAAALIVLTINFLITGRDVPAGLLSLLGGIFGAVFAVDAITRRAAKPHHHDPKRDDANEGEPHD